MKKLTQSMLIAARRSVLPYLNRKCVKLESGELTIDQIYEDVSKLQPAECFSLQKSFNAIYFYRNEKFPEGVVFFEQFQNQPIQGGKYNGGICIISGAHGCTIYKDQAFYGVPIEEIKPDKE